MVLLATEDLGQRGRCQEEEENWSYQPQESLLFSGLQEKKQMLEIIDWGFGQGGVRLYFLKDSGALPGVFHHQVKCFYKMTAEKSSLVEAGSVNWIRQLMEQSSGAQRNIWPQGGQDYLDV